MLISRRNVCSHHSKRHFSKDNQLGVFFLPCRRCKPEKLWQVPKKEKTDSYTKKWNCVVWEVSLAIYCGPSRSCLFITDKFTEKFPPVVSSYSFPSDYLWTLRYTLLFFKVEHEISYRFKKFKTLMQLTISVLIRNCENSYWTKLISHSIQ